MAGGIEEEDINYEIGLFESAALKRSGVIVEGTRGSETKFASKQAEFDHIVAVSNDCNALTSIHDDAAGASAQGISVLYKSSEDKVLATHIYAELVSLTPWADRGLVQRNDLGVLNQTKPPAVIIETDYKTNAAARKLMVDPVWQKKVGEAIAKGTCAFLGVKYIAPSAPLVISAKPNRSVSYSSAYVRLNPNVHSRVTSTVHKGDTLTAIPGGTDLWARTTIGYILRSRVKEI